MGVLPLLIFLQFTNNDAIYAVKSAIFETCDQLILPNGLKILSSQVLPKSFVFNFFKIKTPTRGKELMNKL